MKKPVVQTPQFLSSYIAMGFDLINAPQRTKLCDSGLNFAVQYHGLALYCRAPFARFAAANDWDPQFHGLEELSVGCVYSLDNLWPPLSQRIQWLLKDAPNLKRILPTSLRC